MKQDAIEQIPPLLRSAVSPNSTTEQNKEACLAVLYNVPT